MLEFTLFGESTVCCNRPFDRWMLSGKKKFWYTDDLANGTAYKVSCAMASYMYCGDQQVCLDGYLSMYDSVHHDIDSLGLGASLT